jgi:general secretion pathway protein C
MTWLRPDRQRREPVVRETVPGTSQAVNLPRLGSIAKNLNCFRDLPSVRSVRQALALRRSLTIAHIFFVVTTAYAGALVVSRASALWLEHGAHEAAPSPAKPQSPGLSLPSGQPIDVAAIFQRNLFGSEPIEVADVAQPETVESSDLRLRGTAMLDGRGFAVIQDKVSGRQEVFAIGEKVFDGPRLVAVTDTRAVLLGAGRKQTIEITEDAQPEGRKAKSAGAAASAAATNEVSIRKTGATTFAVDRRAVEHSLENLNTVVTQMRAVPFLRDGKSQGFRVFNIRSGSIFESMGLKNGDVIQAVNGVELNDPTKALALVDDIATVDEIRINLLRNNTPTTFTYSVQ